MKSLDYLLNPKGMMLISTRTQEFLKRYDKDLNYIDPTKRGHISIFSLESFQKLGSLFGFNASFLGDRSYEVILHKNPNIENFPVDENKQILNKLGSGWFKLLFGVYMWLAISHKD